MTTIACKPPILAADSRATEADYSALTDKFVKLYAVNSKVKPILGRVLMAAAGCEFAGELFRRWLIKGGEPDMVQKGVIFEVDGGSPIDVLILHKTGMYTANHLGVLIKIHDKFWAHGTGRQAAMAVMLRGGSAIEAVKTAAELDVHTGGRVTWMKL